MAFRRPIDPLKQHHGAELLHVTVLYVEPQGEEVCLHLHETLLGVYQDSEKFAEQELHLASLV